MPTLDQILSSISLIMSCIGVGVIVLGALAAVLGFVLGLFRGSDTASVQKVNLMRMSLGRSIVLGLEFIVAADVVKTVITPDYYSLGILASLTGIRTILSYFINQEIQSLSTADRAQIR